MRFYSFQIVIEKEPEDPGYFAYSPTLPGCFGNGATIEETKKSIHEAVELHLASLVANGELIPQFPGVVHVEELSVGLPA
jgi:predicted RNase H-like HicB family nuclease